MKPGDTLRDYMTLAEVRARWKLPAESTDLFWYITKGKLKPCVWLRGEHPLATRNEAGAFEPVLTDDGTTPARAFVNAFCYPTGAAQVALYEFAYSHLCDTSLDEPRYFALARPLTLRELMAEGVVLMHDLEQAEQFRGALTDDDLHGKERQSLYRLLVTAVTNAYDWDPLAERSHAIPDLVRDAGDIGCSISYNAAKTHLQRAFAACNPRQKE